MSYFQMYGQYSYSVEHHAPNEQYYCGAENVEPNPLVPEYYNTDVPESFPQHQGPQRSYYEQSNVVHAAEGTSSEPNTFADSQTQQYFFNEPSQDKNFAGVSCNLSVPPPCLPAAVGHTITSHLHHRNASMCSAQPNDLNNFSFEPQAYHQSQNQIPPIVHDAGPYCYPVPPPPLLSEPDSSAVPPPHGYSNPHHYSHAPPDLQHVVGYTVHPCESNTPIMEHGNGYNMLPAEMAPTTGSNRNGYNVHSESSTPILQCDREYNKAIIQSDNSTVQHEIIYSEYPHEISAPLMHNDNGSTLYLHPSDRLLQSLPSNGENNRIVVKNDADLYITSDCALPDTSVPPPSCAESCVPPLQSQHTTNFYQMPSQAEAVLNQQCENKPNSDAVNGWISSNIPATLRSDSSAPFDVKPKIEPSSHPPTIGENRRFERSGHRRSSSSEGSPRRYNRSPTRLSSRDSTWLKRQKEEHLRSRACPRSGTKRSQSPSRSRLTTQFRSPSRRSICRSSRRSRSFSPARSKRTVKRSLSPTPPRSNARPRSSSRLSPRKTTKLDDRRSRASERSVSRARRSQETRKSGRSPSPKRRSERRSERRRLEEPARVINRRGELIEKWRMLNCKTNEDFERRLKEIAAMNSDEILQEESKYWARSAATHPYYHRDSEVIHLVEGTTLLTTLLNEFHELTIKKPQTIRSEGEHRAPPIPNRRLRKCKHHAGCSSSSDDEDEGGKENEIMEELDRKLRHPFRLHRELWHNEPGEMNDGPLCKCSMKARRSGIRHGLYEGSEDDKFRCDPNKNNAGKLYHYRITISPPTNFLSRTPTLINYDGHEYLFEGFSLFSHYKLPSLPVCKVIRFNIEYMILYIEEPYPENFTIRECDLFFEYLFREILELLDLDLYASDSGDCPVFHFMPRFVRELPEKGRELLPMCVVLKHLIACYKPLVPEELLTDIAKTSESRWQEFADEVKGMIVTKPGMKPSSIRVDQLDKNVSDLPEERRKLQKKEKKSSESEPEPEKDTIPFPIIVHFGIRPPQLSYAGNQEYQKAWRDYVRHRHLIANLAKPTMDDKRKLCDKEEALQRMRSKGNMKRDVTVTVSSKGFLRTGLMCDVVQHAMLIPVLSCHLRFHRSLNVLETTLDYKFQNRQLLQLALTHPSYRENFGTNPDHARNSLTNCGIRQPKYGDRRVHCISTKKSGINTLIRIMSRFGSKSEMESNIGHNERLEFLGDAVVEFVATIHLFFVFRDLEEGGLATYRAALVQNQHLALLAQSLNLDAFLLYAHGSDLCHDLELKHALANCFEALMGALFLDGGIDVPDRVFGMTLYGNSPEHHAVWTNYPLHPLQEQEPDGDRHWIEKVDYLKKLAEFEEKIGFQFNHIRLLARSFTDRSVGYTNLTLGSNQRLEFLGDSVLQLVASEYLYKHFPDHHEGHLSLLRSSLVNNKTQSVVCEDLGLTHYASYAAVKTDLKTKDKADLLEAFLGAMYVDKRDLDYLRGFCQVCFFPRLRFFIMNQEWNDPKSKLQQCCLTLRKMDGGEPDIPRYKVVECKGPTNARSYTIAVYFRGERLGKASGRSIQEAEMNAALQAMESCGDLFPQLDRQKRVIARTVRKCRRGKKLVVKNFKPICLRNSSKSLREERMA